MRDLVSVCVVCRCVCDMQYVCYPAWRLIAGCWSIQQYFAVLVTGVLSNFPCSKFCWVNLYGTCSVHCSWQSWSMCALCTRVGRGWHASNLMHATNGSTFCPPQLAGSCGGWRGGVHRHSGGGNGDDSHDPRWPLWSRLLLNLHTLRNPPRHDPRCSWDVPELLCVHVCVEAGVTPPVNWG